MQGVTPVRPEQYFVSDITYIKSREKIHYLSLVTDVFIRKIMRVSPERWYECLKCSNGNENGCQKKSNNNKTHTSFR